MSHPGERDRRLPLDQPGGARVDAAGAPRGSWVARLHGVVVHGRRRAASPLSGVDLQVDPGTLTLLLGGLDNGVETALMVLAGLLPVDGGEAEIAGVRVLPGASGPDPQTEPQSWRHRVGFVPERPSAVGYLTVAENLALPSTLVGARAVDGGRIGRLLRTLRLDGVRDRYPDQLSDTQRRCLALGQALAYAPDLLVVPDSPQHRDAGAPVDAPGRPGPRDPTQSAAGLRPAHSLALSLIDLVQLDGHTVLTALDDPAVRSSAHVTVEFAGGRVVRTERREGP